MTTNKIYSPEEAIRDLNNYVESRGFSLSEKARNIFLFTETLGDSIGKDILYETYLTALLKTSDILKTIIIEQGYDPQELFILCKTIIQARSFSEEYHTYFPPYSSKKRGGFRESVVDACLVAAQRSGVKVVNEANVIEALLDAFDEQVPSFENREYIDKKLHTPYNRLCHIVGQYEEGLSVKFDEIRAELGDISIGRKSSIDIAPSRLKVSVLTFLNDHPDYQKNCFLIMPFSKTPFHQEVHDKLKRIFYEKGLNLFRADDKQYSDDVLSNIETYIYGCKFAVAVHDRVLKDDSNANVALEVGYFLGLKKQVLLLKEKTVKALPSDLQGKLYVEFDGFNIGPSLQETVTKWLEDKRLL